MKIGNKFVLLISVSLILMIVTITGISVSSMTNALYYETEQKLKVSVAEFSGDVEALRNKGFEIDLTVFEGRTRVESSIPNSVNTDASEEVIKRVIEGTEKSAFFRSVDVHGETYCGYYQKVDGTNRTLFAGTPIASIRAEQKELLSTLTLTVVIASLIIIPTTIIISLRIGKRLGKTQESVNVLASNDLSTEFPTYSDTKDESCRISNNLEHLRVSLRSVIAGIKEQSNKLDLDTEEFKATFADINSTVASINQAIDDIAQSTAYIANDTLEMMGGVQDMNISIDVVSKETSTLTTCVNEMNKVSGLVLNLVNNIIVLNKETFTAIEDANDKTRRTNESVSAIQQAVTMIQDIADQTELLALNASIEAAHAGDAGKGFAVVANEIRNLADGSAKGANDIERILKELLTNSEHAMSNMQDVINKSRKQTEDLEETGAMFEKLQLSIKDVSVSSDSIDDQIKVINTSKDAIAERVEGLSAVAEETAAAVQETSASTETLSMSVETCSDLVVELADMATDMNISVDNFKL